MLYFQQQKNKGLNDIKYDILLYHSCRKMIIQHANLLGLVHIHNLIPLNLLAPTGALIVTVVY